MRKFILLSILLVTLSSLNTYTKASVNETLDIECSRCSPYRYQIIQEKGIYYIEYENTTDNSYLLNYKLTKMDGSISENNIKVKPQKKDKIKVGKGNDFKITGSKLVESK